MADLKSTGKEQGRFARGQSGNPRGRPLGTKNRATLVMQDMLDGDGELIVKKAIALAKAGDPVALRLCIDRLVPRRGRVVQVDIPKLAKAADLVDACASIIEAAAAGRMTLAEAREFLQLLDIHRKAIETQDLAVRVELLEEVEIRRWSPQ